MSYVKDAVILVSTILVLLIIITVFGGCISCSNGQYSEGLTTDVGNTAPLLPTVAPQAPAPAAAVAATSEPAQAISTVQGYDSAGTEFAAFRSAT